MLCILAVPSYINTSEFVRFVGVMTPAPAIKLLRDPAQPGRYMVVITFADQSAADDFFVSHNGRRFSSLEAEECQVFYISEVEIVAPDGAHLTGPDGIRFLARGATSRDSAELPTCPVCLERIDSESTGALTILCNHTFHSDCLAQWKDSGCPVCRYALQPLGGDNQCMHCECTVAGELWICLVCGHVGCGRSMKSHALEHYQATGHSYALNLETKRVWDYVGDGYVHRVIQNKADGKLVEVDCSKDDKIVAIELEYSHLVQTHLAAFERELAEVKREHQRALTKLEAQRAAATKQKEQAAHSLTTLQQEAAQYQERLSHFEDEKEKAEQKFKAATKKLATATAKVEELEQLNKSLTENQRLWAEKLVESERKHAEAMKTSEQKIAELEGQLKDLMFHLDGQRRVGEEAELSQGDIVTTQGPEQAPQPRRLSGTGRRHHGKK